MISATP
jgi:hypothetical protein